MNYSPLRYPGGKNKITSFISGIISDNGLTNRDYAEPFAGGGAIALFLLFNGTVKNIKLNDKDFFIYSFWQTILNDTERFIKKIADTDITISEWKRQKDILRDKENCNSFDAAFSCFFLNRTNRSGILKAGCMGGKTQAGNCKLDIRFNKTALIQRIKHIAELKDKIIVENKDACDFIKGLPPKTFIYADPPYYQQGKNLYLTYFSESDHKKFYDVIKDCQNNWVVSYDDCGPINDIFKNENRINFELQYSVLNKIKGKEVLFFSKDLRINNPFDVKQLNFF